MIRFAPEHALWRDEKPAVPAAVLPPRLLLHASRRHLRGEGRRRRPDRLFARDVHLRRPAGAGRQGQSRLRRLPPARPDQPARLLRRDRRVPRRELFPRGRPRARSTACRRAGWRSTPPIRRARSFRSSAPSGSSGRAPARELDRRACAARQPERRGAPTASPSGPGETTVYRRRGDALSRASTSTEPGIAPLTSMFFFGAERPRRRRRLPPGGARFRRARDPERPRRADLAAADQSGRPAGQRLRRRQPARLRPDAAPARLPRLRGPRGALREAPEPLGRADRRLGRRRGAAGRDPDRRPRSTTTSSPSGGRASRLRAEERIHLHLPHALGRERARSRCRSRRSIATRIGAGPEERAAVRARLRRRER